MRLRVCVARVADTTRLRRNQRVLVRRASARIDYDALARTRTIFEYDQSFVAPYLGYRSVEDYYADATSVNHVARVRTPLLFVNARDDPFCRVSSALAATAGLPSARAAIAHYALRHGPAIPVDAIARNPYTILALFDRGGHVGFLSVRPAWLPGRIGVARRASGCADRESTAVAGSAAALVSLARSRPLRTVCRRGRAFYCAPSGRAVTGAPTTSAQVIRYD